MNKIALVLITLFILVIGISCASAACVNHGVESSIKTKGSTSKKLVSSSLKAPAKKAAAKKTVKKSTKKSVKKTAKKVKKTTKKTTLNKKANKKVNKVVKGWDPKKHQVSCESIGDGLHIITYDDGYRRIVDNEGKILSYGY